MDNRIWTDDEYRRRAIDTAALDNSILHYALSTARVNGLIRSVAIECALLMLCEENRKLFNHAVDAESRAVPRNLIIPETYQVRGLREE